MDPGPRRLSNGGYESAGQNLSDNNIQNCPGNEEEEWYDFDFESFCGDARAFWEDMAAADGIVDSVFLSSFRDALHTTPTPLATPDVGSLVASNLGSPSPDTFVPRWTVAQVEVQRNLDWSTATRFLAKLVVEVGGFVKIVGGSSGRWRSDTPVEVKLAMQNLLRREPGSYHDRDELIDWYMREACHNMLSIVNLRFTTYGTLDPVTEPNEVYEQLCCGVTELAASFSLYREAMDVHLLPSVERAEAWAASVYTGPEEHRFYAGFRVGKLVAKFDRDVREWIIHACSSGQLYVALGVAVIHCGSIIFGVKDFGHRFPTPQELQSFQTLGCQLLRMLKDLHYVGLSGRNAQNALFWATHDLVDMFLGSKWMKVDWINGESVVQKLRVWILSGIVPFMKRATRCLNPGKSRALFTDEHSAEILDLAMSKLARVRSRHLLDFIARWPDSRGAILDLKECVTTFAARGQLVQAFEKQLHERLLCAGSTTTDVLNIYIYTIRAFAQIDPRGALIGRAARPIQLFLKHRHDTARIIVSSMLADVGTDGPRQVESGISSEIAKEMQKPIVNMNDRDLDLNWDDMDWAPAPVDAGPEFQRTKVEDIFGHLFQLYDRDAFIDVLKTFLGHHLLRNKNSSDFAKEIKVLELFKLRLGDDKLQSCEVMLHDVDNSRRVNLTVHQSEPFKANQDPETDTPEANAQIVSTHFWPELPSLEINLPKPMKDIQDRYARGFESTKGAIPDAIRPELEWNNALGTIEIELELKDRVITETVLPLFAAVISLFDEDEHNGKNSSAGIADQLNVDVAEVLKVLKFWIGKGVIQSVQNEPDLYEVVDDVGVFDRDEASANAAAAAQAQNPMLSHPNTQIYSNYITSMLASSSNPLKVKAIAQRLKLFVPSGFPFSEDVLAGFLDAMVKEGKLKEKNGLYGMKKT